MKLIDASKCPCNACGAKQYCNSNCLIYWKWFDKPVDAVEVVRCKDCRHYRDGVCENIEYIMDGYYRGTFEVKRTDDFCSNGERKDGGTDNDKGASEE